MPEVLSLEENILNPQVTSENLVSTVFPEKVESPISLEFAQELLIQHTKAIGFESISISSALNRVLHEDIIAPLNIPPFNRSPLDGFVLRAADIAKASPANPVYIEVNQNIPAGSPSQKEVGENQAARIMTGAPIPSGADVIIKIEDVNYSGNHVEVTKALSPFENVCFAGEDIEQGEAVLCGGEYICPAGIGILAALGIDVVDVNSIPRVAIIGTGDELISVQDELRPGKIYDSNTFSLASYVQQIGACPVFAGTVTDDTELIAVKILENLKQADMVITTGGVSVGDSDLVCNALRSIGASILFHRIDMRPGTPALGAEKDGKLIICLSGNKAAAFVTFQLLARPAIASLMGIKACCPPVVTAVLGEHYRKTSGQRNLLRGQLSFDDCMLKVNIAGKQNPGIIRSTLNCNALIDVPANFGPLNAGTRVSIFLL
jgi:molybdopterin molybdotransferase